MPDLSKQPGRANSAKPLMMHLLLGLLMLFVSVEGTHAQGNANSTSSLSKETKYILFGVLGSLTFVVLIVVLALACHWICCPVAMAGDDDLDESAMSNSDNGHYGSNDRKLAHSAQMYHYQHQKQQMMAAMEKKGSDDFRPNAPPEYEGEKDSDMNIFECPGLAKAGELEIHNPMFQAAANGQAPAAVTHQ